MADNSQHVRKSINFKAQPDASDVEARDLAVDGSDSNRLKYNAGSGAERVLLQSDRTALEAADTAEASTRAAADSTLTTSVTAAQTDITAHKANTANPHGVTKAQIGLGNADNTSDSNKPISTAQAAAIALKADKTTTVNGYALSSNVTITKSDLSLGNVDNTSDATKNSATATLSNKTLASPAVTGTLAGATATLSGTLAVTGTTTASDVNASGAVSAGSLSVTNNATISGSATVTTALDSAGPLHAYSTVQVDGALTAGGQLNINAGLVHSNSADTATGSNVALSFTTPSKTLTNGSLVSVASITSPATGKTQILVNNTGVTITVVNEYATATASQRIVTGTGADMTLANGASIILHYSASDSRWHVVGGSAASTGTGETNFITNGTAEVATTGWATYDDGTTASTPVDGTGGSPVITWTRRTDDVLMGTASFRFTKPTADRRGQGVSYDFTIDAGYQAKVLQISFDYKLYTGTSGFNAGTSTTDSDITVWIYDKTNGVLIQPSTYKLFASSNAISTTFVSNFQTAPNSVNYRLILHTATTNSTQFTMHMDDFKVKPSQYVYGTPITDWKPYTPTITGFGTPTAVSFFSRRVGDSLEVTGSFNNGTTTATNATFTLGYGGANGNVFVDTTKVAAQIIVGHGNVAQAGSTYFGMDILTVAANQGVLAIGIQASAATSAVIATGTGTVLSGAVQIAFFAQVPILGWSSSAQTSDQADSRVVAMQVSQAAPTATITSSFSLVKFTGSATSDTHAGYSPSTGLYTVPVSGYYRCTGQVLLNGTYAGGNVAATAIFKNGAIVQGASLVCQAAGSPTFYPMITTTVYCNAGDTLALYARSQATSPAIASDVTSNYLNIERLSQASLMSATESVSCTYGLTTAQAVSANAVIKYDTRGDDSHGFFSTSTGLATVPYSGKYRVTIITHSDGAGGTYLKKSGVSSGYMTTLITSNLASSSMEIRCLAGETLGIYSDAARTFSAAIAVGYLNQVSITRIGN
jgi:hypothetical protein